MTRERPRLDVTRRSARLERLRGRAPRYAFVVTATVVALVGIRELISPEQAPAPAAVARTDRALEDFAEGFARAYLTYDAARPQLRERALRQYTPDELGSDAGYAPPARGAETVSWTRVAQNQEALAGGRIVVVAVGLAGEERTPYLAVPVVRRSDGALVLSGYPALVGSPIAARPPLAAREEVQDPEVTEVVERVLGNYLAGERADLEADLSPTARVALPDEELRAASVDDVVWVAGEESGAVLATVSARGADGSNWTLTYELGLERLRGRVLVTFIETVANQP